MPPAPLTSRFGKLAGRPSAPGSSCRSCCGSRRSACRDPRAAMRDLLEAHLGVAHRRRRVVVDRAEIPLPVDQRHAHGEFLRHAHQRVVDRLVAVRMVLAHHLADDGRGLAVGLVPVHAHFVHGVEDAPVHGLQPVAHVGKRARDDHAHRVVDVRGPHLLGDGDRLDVAVAVGRRRVAFVCQGKNRVFLGGCLLAHLGLVRHFGQP